MKRRSLTVLLILISLITMICFEASAEEHPWMTLFKKIIKLSKEKKTDEAIIVAEEALTIAKKTFGEKDKVTAFNYYMLGRMYLEKKLFSKSISNYKKSLAIYQELSGIEEAEIISAMEGVGINYFWLKDYKNAKFYMEKVVKAKIKTLGRKNAKTIESIDTLARINREMGDYTSAEKLFLEALKLAKENLGEEDLITIAIEQELAVNYSWMGKFDKAEKLYLKALSSREKKQKKDQNEIALILNNLSNLYNHQSRYSEAVTLSKRALKIRKEEFGENHRVTILACSVLAENYIGLGHYSKAEDILMDLLQKIQKHKKETTDTAVIYFAIGKLYSNKHKNSQALEMFQNSLEINKKYLGLTHPVTLKLMNAVAQTKFDMGQYIEAEKLLKKVLTLCEHKLGKEHHETADALESLASLYQEIRDFEKAEYCYGKALTIVKKNFGTESPNYAITIAEMAQMYYQKGKYIKAEKYYKEAKKILESTYGEDHPITSSLLFNYSALYIELGRYSEAESLILQKMDSDEKSFGMDSIPIAKDYSRLGSIYKAKQEYVKAELFFLKALKIMEEESWDSKPDIISIKTNLADLYSITNRPEEAEALYLRSLEDTIQIYGKKNLQLAKIYNNMSYFYHLRKQFGKSEEFLLKTIELFKYNSMTNHPKMSILLFNLSVLSAAKNEPEKALKYMLEALEVEDKIIKDVFTISSEKEKLQFLSTIYLNYEGFNSLIATKLNSNQLALRSGLNVVLNRKGIVIDAVSQERISQIKSKDSSIISLNRRFNKVSSELSSLYLSGPRKMKKEDYERRILDLTAEKERLEKELISSGVQISFNTKKINCDSVSNQLPSKSTLIEIINFRLVDFTSKKLAESVYYAYILHSQKDKSNDETIIPKLIYLGKASEINNAVTEFRNEINKTKTLWKDGVLNEKKAILRIDQKSRKLYRLVMAPMMNYLDNTNTLYISPDGNLNLIPFEALRMNSGEYLIERYHINYLSSGRDLLSFPTIIPMSNETVIVANPDYNAENESYKIASTGISKDNTQKSKVSTRSKDLALTTWNSLPGTKIEADKISQLLKGEKLRMFTGKEASEGKVKKLNSPLRLHVATHGYFLDHQESSKELKQKSEKAILKLSFSDNFQVKEIENPLLRSGLILAGANHFASSSNVDYSEDGILTALEITGIPLSETDLVVLSACETGLGNVRQGEGVFGLRRAFQLAGARTIIMSLWSIPDEETSELMTRFYSEIKKGTKKSEALQKAKLSIMQERRKNQGVAHPYFWASFISVGEP